MESEVGDHESKKCSRASDGVEMEISISITGKDSVCGEVENSTSRDHCGEKAANGDCVTIDIEKPKPSNEDSKDESVCRICLGSEESSQLMELGCDCKGDLGFTHKHCAEAWFTQKRDRLCEICGRIAKNVNTVNGVGEMPMSAMERNEVRVVIATLHPDLEGSRRCKHFCLNFLLVLLILLFVLPWLVRGSNVF